MKSLSYTVLAALLGGVLFCSLNAFARPTVVDLPNRYPSGLYAGSDHPDEGMTFRVNRNNLQELRFMITLSCEKLDTGATVPTPFIPIISSTPDILLDSYGRANITGMRISDGSRNLLFNMNVHVRADGTATVNISLVNEPGRSWETCGASRVFHLRRNLP